MSTYRPFPYKGFGGGLNLRDSPEVVQEEEAINALNVLFTTRGAVKQRSGYAQLTASQGTNRYDSLTAFYKADGTKQIVAGAGNRLEALSAAGAVTATDATPTASPHYFQRFGGPTAEHIYISNGTDTVRRWTGSIFETPSYSGVTPNGRFVGLSITDNRLVVARFSGATAGNNPSTVRFSNEGDPLTFGSTNYVDLTPGDGEEIMGVVSWRDLVVVFKQTKFFVFYGNSTDDDGDPVFNYRPVDAGVGLVASRAKAVAEQGIYFLDRSGIYFTTGAQAARVSDPVEPIFHGGASVYFTGGELNDGSITECTMAYHDGRLWLAYPGGSSNVNSRTLVFDPLMKWFTLYNIPAGPMAVFRPGNVDELIFGYASGSKHIGRHFEGSTYLADDMSQSGTGGSAISALWQGGWFNYGVPAVKTIREAKLAGTGLVTVAFARDYRQSSPWSQQIQFSAAAVLWDSGALWDSGVLWGPTKTVSPKPLRKAIRGESFSLILTNSTINRTFQLQRLTTHLREVRIPSVVKVN